MPAICFPLARRPRWLAAGRPSLLDTTSRPDLFGAPAAPVYRPNLDKVRARLEKILAEARAAKTLPGSRRNSLFIKRSSRRWRTSCLRKRALNSAFASKKNSNASKRLEAVSSCGLGPFEAPRGADPSSAGLRPPPSPARGEGASRLALGRPFGGRPALCLCGRRGNSRLDVGARSLQAFGDARDFLVRQDRWTSDRQSDRI